jgi:hypothetical protein
MIVALELMILFLFNSHAEEKDVRKNNRTIVGKRVWEKR